MPNTPQTTSEDCPICTKNRTLPLHEKEAHTHAKEWKNTFASVGDGVEGEPKGRIEGMKLPYAPGSNLWWFLMGIGFGVSLVRIFSKTVVIINS